MGKRKTSFVFFIGDEGAVLSHIVGNKVEKKVFVSSSDSDSMATLNDVIKKNRSAPIAVLLDSIDQSYQTQSFPPVAKLSVQKLVNKRLERDFAPGDITSSLPLGKEKSGRQDWKFLLISVVPSPQLMQWLDFILELDNPFQGIFLVPVEAENLIKKISGKKKPEEGDAMWHMLVLHNKVSGFRQIITKNGRLTFTRLTQASATDNDPLVIAGNIEQEVVSTIEYLKRLSYNESEGLDVTVIASPEITEAIDAHKIGKHNESRFISPAQAAEIFSMSAEDYADNHFSDILFAAFFQSCKKKVLPLQTDISKAIQKMQKGLLAAKYLTIILSLLILGGTGYFAYSWFDNFSSEESFDQSIQRSQSQMSKIKKEAELLPKDIKKMEDVISIYETFSEQKYFPLNFVKQLIDINADGVLIRDINWSSDSNFADRAKKTEENVNVQIQIDFTQKFETAEARLEQINNYLSALRIKFPDYKIRHSDVPGTLYEGKKIALDFTNPESRNLASGSISMSVNFMIAPEPEDNRRGRRRR